MDLQTRKLKLIQEFLKVQREDVVQELGKILKKENKKGKQKDLNPFTLDEFNSRIDQSMDDSKNDRLIESDELKAKINNWE